MFNTQISVRIDQGKKRDFNEDYASFFEPDSPHDIKHSGNLYVVADGVGRSSKGDLASRYAVHALLHEYYQHPLRTVEARLRTIIRQVGNDINSYAKDSSVFRRMATTLVAAVIRGETLTVANVGDSRAYLLRGGKLEQLTQDHSLVAEMLRNGTLTLEEAEKSSLKNRITRSLGGERDVEVDVFSGIALQPGDKLLLCSDGLSRYASEDDLVQMMVAGSPDQVTKRLIHFSNQQGGEDNITALVVDVGKKVEKAAPAHAPAGLPGSVDWESLETQPKIPAGVKWGERKKRERLLVPYLVGLAGLIVLGVLFATPIGKKLWGNPSSTPTLEEKAIVLPTEEPTRTSAPSSPAPTITPSLTPASLPTATPRATLKSTLPAVAYCVYRYQQPEPGINSLYLLLKDTFKKDIPYRIFINEYAPRVTCVEEPGRDCDYDPVVAYEWVEDGWVLKLPAIATEKCLAANGKVVLEE